MATQLPLNGWTPRPRGSNIDAHGDTGTQELTLQFGFAIEYPLAGHDIGEFESFLAGELRASFDGFELSGVEVVGVELLGREVV